jgi:hypothetical protein
VPSTRPIHRQALARAIACLLLALVTLVAPSANAQDLRSPDARDAALAQERYYGSYGGSPAQDLRSPDARDAGLVQPTPPANTAEPVGHDGIAPLPFAVALFGALIAGMGVATALRTVHARHRAA